MVKKILLGFMPFWPALLMAQDTLSSTSTKKQRLDFAKTYLEVGGSYMPSFTGKRLENGAITSFDQPASISQYLVWGGFHFWGHAEFYVKFPLNQLNLNRNILKRDDEENNNDPAFRMNHSVATGARFYPIPVRERKIIPYIGANWAGIDFRQVIGPEKNQTELTKEFMLNYDAGLLYNHKSLGLRLGVNYLSDTKWNYPVSRTQKASIKTPSFTATLGLLYAFDMTKNDAKKQGTTERWNSYPALSGISYKAKRFGDFFIGAGPSSSFSLVRSEYNQSRFPYLKDRLSSSGLYFDLTLGYQFNTAGLFTALTFRNPRYETEGYGSKQTIKKTSLTWEVNKFLTDYVGFAPYLGVNVAYDRLRYRENTDGVERRMNFNRMIEPGITFGWDIAPGKTDEALILRTNLRWYPFSEFEIDGKEFKFSQLEYNLIQAVFYPQRMKKKKRK